MDRIESLAGDPSETLRVLHDEELQTVNGGNMLALGGPDTRPQSGESDIEILWKLNPVFIKY